MPGRNFIVGPLALLLALCGCGQELTAGGQKGEVNTVVTDSDAAPAASRSAGGDAPAFSLSRAAVPTGTVTVHGSVELLDVAGHPTTLTEGDGEASVTIGAAGSETLAIDSVFVGAYPRVRITFTRVEASVTGGLLAGTVEVRGTVRVDLPQPLVIERPVELVVRPDGAHRLAIDLNAAVWLAAVNPVTRTVPSSAFAGAVAVRVE